MPTRKPTASRRPRATESEYEVAFDRKGALLQPGDHVSIKLYPRGSTKGTVTISKSVKCVTPDNRMVPALTVTDDEDGTVYNLPGSKSVLKLVQKSASATKRPRATIDPADIIHIRKTGGKIDRRYRMGGMYKRVSGENLCGAEKTFKDCDRANAEATLQHAALFAKRTDCPRLLETAARLCPACVALLKK